MLERLDDADIRQACKLRLEAMEQWLRRLAHSKLSAVSLDYLSASDEKGNRLIKMDIVKRASARIQKNVARYPRPVDALDLDDLISIVCNQRLFEHFKDALQGAFPNGRQEAHTFLMRLVEPRNHLAHSNPITLRQAERVVCYSGDVIESLKEYYARMGQSSEYNVPTIFRLTDSIGNSFERVQLPTVHDGGIMMNLSKNVFLRPGDILTVEVEVDPSFDPNEYTIRWASTKSLGSVDVHFPKIVLPIADVHVAMQWDLQCNIVTNAYWHRMHNGVDDLLLIYYQVLPPV